MTPATSPLNTHTTSPFLTSPTTFRRLSRAVLAEATTATSSSTTVNLPRTALHHFSRITRSNGPWCFGSIQIGRVAFFSTTVAVLQPSQDNSDRSPSSSSSNKTGDAYRRLQNPKSNPGNEQLARERAEQMAAMDHQFAPIPNVPRRIHIMGTGSIGKLVAHSLAGIPDPPPITLIFHRYKLLQAWKQGPKVITVQDGQFDVPRGGFDVELAPWSHRQHGVDLSYGQDIYTEAEKQGIQPHEAAKILTENRKAAEEAQTTYDPMGALVDDSKGTDQSSDKPPLPGDDAESDEPIHNLILTTKTIRTKSAIQRIRHRLGKDSTICLLQNGMGVIDELNKEFFPDPATRPNYVQGIISHGANVPPEKADQDPFFVVHAGHGTLALAVVPREPVQSTETAEGDDGKLQDSQLNDLAPTARYLIRTLTRTPVLCAVAFTPTELLQVQLEKLSTNSILNPLTSLLDARNGSLLYNFPLSRTMRLMLAETSLVLRSLPELRGIPTVPHRFSPERLETIVVGVANKTAENVSSMLADVRAGRPTEIEYINGYIVKRGEELGIKCVVNYAVMQAVLGKALMQQREIDDQVPLEGGSSRASAGGLNPDL